ncbi:Ima1 N-terminal domain-containing protein [Cladochytrium replicatum]|nr:Ima1 N-terminal domain-containing protein [Cladochytrium replicatum]
MDFAVAGALGEAHYAWDRLTEHVPATYLTLILALLALVVMAPLWRERRRHMLSDRTNEQSLHSSFACFYCSKDYTFESTKGDPDVYFAASDPIASARHHPVGHGTVTLYCPSCDAESTLNTVSGEYLHDPIHVPAMADPHMNKTHRPMAPSDAPSQPTATGSPFCDRCIMNQSIVLDLLRNYVPDESDPEYDSCVASYPDFKTRVEERYPPVCHDCAYRVENELSRRKHAFSWLFSHAKPSWDRTDQNNRRKQSSAGEPERSSTDNGLIKMDIILIFTGWIMAAVQYLILVSHLICRSLCNDHQIFRCECPTLEVLQSYQLEFALSCSISALMSAVGLSMKRVQAIRGVIRSTAISVPEVAKPSLGVFILVRLILGFPEYKIYRSSLAKESTQDMDFLSLQKSVGYSKIILSGTWMSLHLISCLLIIYTFTKSTRRTFRHLLPRQSTIANQPTSPPRRTNSFRFTDLNSVLHEVASPVFGVPTLSPAPLPPSSRSTFTKRRPTRIRFRPASSSSSSSVSSSDEPDPDPTDGFDFRRVRRSKRDTMHVLSDAPRASQCEELVDRLSLGDELPRARLAFGATSPASRWAESQPLLGSGFARPELLKPPSFTQHQRRDGGGSSPGGYAARFTDSMEADNDRSWDLAPGTFSLPDDTAELADLFSTAFSGGGVRRSAVPLRPRSTRSGRVPSIESGIDYIISTITKIITGIRKAFTWRLLGKPRVAKRVLWLAAPVRWLSVRWPVLELVYASLLGWSLSYLIRHEVDRNVWIRARTVSHVLFGDTGNQFIIRRVLMGIMSIRIALEVALLALSVNGWFGVNGGAISNVVVGMDAVLYVLGFVWVNPAIRVSGYDVSPRKG